MEQKPKVFNINNFIASETGRLTSLSIKRDLSLGGNKPRKVYKPNLNVVRPKNKAKVAINSRMQQHNRRNMKATSSRSNQSQYIQSSSIFSEGAGEYKRPRIHSDRYLSHGDLDPTAMAVPNMIKMNWKVNSKDEKAVLEELLAEDEDDSVSESECDYSPIVLPLKNNKVGFLQTFKIKKEIMENKQIKEEVPQPMTSVNSEQSGDLLNYDIPLLLQDNKFYDDEHPCVSLIKMPDSLPGKGFSDNSDEVTDFDLSQMIEGKIGQIVLRRSGAAEIEIGHMKYVLDSVEQNSFKEELMCVPADVKSSTFGLEMISLGNIDERYILSPSWRNLFGLKDLKGK